ncbi:MAG TPA: hypothetical protein VF053_00485 [Streptosporangiales bacterium]
MAGLTSKSRTDEEGSRVVQASVPPDGGRGLGELTSQAFEGFDIERLDENTALTAELDQAALYGALNRIDSLGLELLEVVRVPST